jgi:hypothetical protein
MSQQGSVDSQTAQGHPREVKKTRTSQKRNSERLTAKSARAPLEMIGHHPEKSKKKHLCREIQAKTIDWKQ